MAAFFEKLAEERILKALKEGVFQNLPGEGKPLPKDEVLIPEDLRLAYRMLKTADFLPPELELRKEIHSMEELLEGAKDVQDKLRITRKLNVMIQKLNILKPTRPDCEVLEHYMPRVLAHMETASLRPEADRHHEKKL